VFCWKNSDWDVSPRLTSSHTRRLQLPRTASLPRQAQIEGCATAVAHHQPPKAQPRGNHCPQARSGSSAQALGLGQPMWGSVSISFGFSHPGFTHPMLPGSAQESCPCPSWGALGVCSAPWQELEVASSGSTFRIKDVSTCMVSSLCRLHGTEKPPVPLFLHATAPFSPSEG